MVGGAPVVTGWRTFPLNIMPADYYAELDKEELEASPKEESATTLVPKSLVGSDVEIGDTVSFKIEHIYEDEVEVSLVSKEEETPAEQPKTAEDELDSLMTKG